jgi:CheY-like chemotaxis protein
MPTTIVTDPLRLRQILLNIVGNAIKFTEKGSVDVRVKMLFNDGQNKLAFIVKDTGEGIDPDKVKRLFAPFTQADPSTTRRFGGTGLGLVLSRELAQALGGDVTLLDSQRGEGSTFCITIDPGMHEEVLFRSYDPQPMKNVTNLLQVPELKKNLSNLDILIVDDSADNQALIQKILRSAGARVETAANGKEALERALHGKFSLVLMDLQMPEMDGYEATKELRRRGYDRPIIALTAHAMKEERKKCLDNGFNDHLTKPIDRVSLLEALSQYPA